MDEIYEFGSLGSPQTQTAVNRVHQVVHQGSPGFTTVPVRVLAIGPVPGRSLVNPREPIGEPPKTQSLTGVNQVNLLPVITPDRSWLTHWREVPV